MAATKAQNVSRSSIGDLLASNSSWTELKCHFPKSSARNVRSRLHNRSQPRRCAQTSVRIPGVVHLGTFLGYSGNSWVVQCGSGSRKLCHEGAGQG